jgi:ABC-2 type transport system ATP-binding protein
VLQLTVADADRIQALQALREIGAEDPTDDQHLGRIVLPARDGSRTLTEALHRLHAANIAPQDVALHKPTLDDVFLAMTGHLPTTASRDGDDVGDGAGLRTHDRRREPAQ